MTLIILSKGPGVATLLLKRIVTLVPQTLQLRKLVLQELDVDGDNLISLFDRHRRNLQNLTLCKVVLTKALECMVALSRTEVYTISFEDLRVRDEAGNLQHLV